MNDLIERINLIIAQCRDSNESADLWVEIRDEIKRLNIDLRDSTLLLEAYRQTNAKLQAVVDAAKRSRKVDEYGL